MGFRALAWSLLLLVFTVPPALGRSTLEPETDLNAQPSLVAERAMFEPGAVNTVGLRFKIRPGWHIYWPGQNDTGFAPQFEWELPAGWEIERTLWPAPKRYTSPGEILDHVYEDEVTLLVLMRVPAEAASMERATIRASGDWLVCEEACIPEFAEMELTLPVMHGSAASSLGKGDGFDAIASARDRLPMALPVRQNDLTMAWNDKTLTITPSRAFEWAAFYPSDASAKVASLYERGRVTSGSLVLETGAAHLPPDNTDRLRGILEIHRGGDRPGVLYWIDEPVGG